MFKRLYSWLVGREIGEVRYSRCNPYMTGNTSHFLPVTLWGDEEWETVRFHLIKHTWNGFDWDREKVVCRRISANKLEQI